MPIRHCIEAGETTTLLSDRYGFFAKTIWRDPANDELRSKRKDMNELVPGDVLIIPDKKIRSVEKSHGARYTFLRKGIPAKFRLQIKVAGQPLANRSYHLEVDGCLLHGITDNEGRLEQFIPPRSQRGQLYLDRGPGIKPLRTKIAFGHLQPIEELAGVKMRLLNLGYPCGEPNGPFDDNVRKSLRDFQLHHGLNPDGELNAATVARLHEVHDH